MLILDTTTKSLQIKLAAAVTTNQLPFSVSYVNSTGTTTTPGEQDGASNGTTAVTILSAPASSSQALVKNIVIQNADTAAATVTVIYNNNSTLRNIVVATLSVGDQLIYEDGSGWSAVNSAGNLKTSGSGGVSQITNSDGTLTISPTSGNVVASLAALSSGKILVGNGSNVAAAVSMSGDATLSNTGAITVTKTNGTALGSLATLNTVNNGNWSGTALSAANGGTGNTSLTAHSVLLGEGTGAVGFATTGTAGQLLIDQGSGSDPSFKAMSGDATLTSSGAVTLATVNSNVGSYTNASITVNAKGLITAASTGSGGGSVTYNAIAGLLPSSITGTSTTASMTINTGQATDSTNTTAIALSSSASWTVSNGNAINGYSGGTTLPNSSTVHFFLCTGGSGTGTFASTSLTPTLPSGYSTYYRRIFSLKTNGSGAPIPYTAIEIGGGALRCWLATATQDYSSTLSTTPTAVTLNVPSGIKMGAIGRTNQAYNAGYPSVNWYSPDEPYSTQGPAYGSAPGFDLNDNGNISYAAFVYCTTNTSAQIYGVASGSSAAYLTTRGWDDFRRS